jgi:hypothetical protein
MIYSAKRMEGCPDIIDLFRHDCLKMLIVVDDIPELIGVLTPFIRKNTCKKGDKTTLMLPNGWSVTKKTKKTPPKRIIPE